ncbi:MAG: hypothetical protein IJV33_01820 [Bacteroidaceae bacterium]|nr:hypothetical protein [Bacteroidaceae bacterium]
MLYQLSYGTLFGAELSFSDCKGSAFLVTDQTFDTFFCVCGVFCDGFLNFVEKINRKNKENYEKSIDDGSVAVPVSDDGGTEERGGDSGAE